MIVYSFVKIIQTEKFSKSEKNEEKERKRKKIYKELNYANVNKYDLNNDLMKIMNNNENKHIDNTK